MTIAESLSLIALNNWRNYTLLFGGRKLRTDIDSNYCIRNNRKFQEAKEFKPKIPTEIK